MSEQLEHNKQSEQFVNSEQRLVNDEQFINTELQQVEVDSDTGDVFVLILLPQLPALNSEKPLEIEICGRSIIDWTMSAIGSLPYKQIPVAKTDDILSLTRAHATEHKYICVLYADTPLLTANTLEQAISFVRTYECRAGKLPRGWIFETEYIKNKEMAAPEEISNLPPEDFIVAYNFSQLAMISAICRNRINIKHLGEGVQIIDPNAAYIDAEVAIEKGALIEPNVHLCGETIIKSGAKILSGSRITDSTICKDAIINNSQIAGSEVGEKTSIGPFANLRKGNKIGKECRITNFVELKNSRIGDKTKIAHMSYVGDAVLGKGCNIGCGVVFCNYNGKVKEKCVLGDNVFVGSNCNLVAPLKLEDSSYIAAGSTITKDVPKHALAIARTQQIVKENYWNADPKDNPS